MKKIILKILAIIVGIGFAIYMLIDYQYNPPELARITNLRVEYYTVGERWENSASIPTAARRLRVCGVMEKSKVATLLVTISEPDDKNIFIRQDEYYFDIHPGEFCIYLYLMYSAAPGNYTLWMLDARNTVAQLGIKFIDQ